MISQNPNLRFVKPLSKYMDLKVRMVGRQRFAVTHSVSGSNITNVTLPFVPHNIHTVEIYLGGSRVVGGYTIVGQNVTFSPALSGSLEFISDDIFANMEEKWLVIPTPNLIQSNDADTSAYGSDRRAGQNIATKAHPICITQGAIGFCRPSNDGEQLLYSSYYGQFGRDTITYAIMTDMGQLSDYRCVDIRVRDPAYTPPIRLGCVSAVSSPVKIGDNVVDITPNGQYQIYGDVRTGGSILLPNPKDLTPKEFHFIVQGLDEVNEWLPLDEYFDPGQITIELSATEGFTLTHQGTGSAMFPDDYVLSFMCTRLGGTQTVVVKLGNTPIFTGTITPNHVSAIDPSYLEVRNPVLTLDEGGDSTPVWTYNSDWAAKLGINLIMDWSNPVFETRNVSAKANIDYYLDLYDPVAELQGRIWPYEQIAYGSFTTAENPLENEVVHPENGTTVLANGLFWENSDPFSPMFRGNLEVYHKYQWRIVAATP